MKHEVSNNEDILDSRDVIARRDELQDERDAITEPELLAAWDIDNGAELSALNDFIDEGSSEWKHGETLVRETYFKEYAQELAEDIGALKDCDRWPATCIDWEHAARELRYDYTGADFDGITYYFRS